MDNTKKKQQKSSMKVFESPVSSRETTPDPFEDDGEHGSDFDYDPLSQTGTNVPAMSSDGNPSTSNNENYTGSGHWPEKIPLKPGSTKNKNYMKKRRLEGRQAFGARAVQINQHFVQFALKTGIIKTDLLLC